MMIVKNLLMVMLGVFVAFAAVELLLRRLPVSDGLGREASTRFEPLVLSKPGKSFVSSIGWNLQLYNRGTINSDGFHDVIDFPETGQKNVTAVIGDSFIEATMVPYERSLQGKLRRLLGESSHVIGLGAAGADLGTYSFFLQRSSELWGLNRVVLLINEGDFTQAMLPAVDKAYYVVSDKGVASVKLPRNTAKVNKLKELIKKSNLAQYLAGPLRLWPSNIVKRVKKYDLRMDLKRSKNPLNEGFSSNVVSCIDHFIMQINEIKDTQQTEIVVILYSGFKSPYGLDNVRSVSPFSRIFEEKCKLANIETVDASTILSDYSITHKVRPRWMNDGHWKPIAHEVIATEIYKRNLAN